MTPATVTRLSDALAANVPNRNAIQMSAGRGAYNHIASCQRWAPSMRNANAVVQVSAATHAHASATRAGCARTRRQLRVAATPSSIVGSIVRPVSELERNQPVHASAYEVRG